MDFESFLPLLWLLLLILPIGAYAFTLARRPPWRMRGALACRLLAMALLVLALCQPSVPLASRSAHLIFLLDVSESVDLAAARKACAELKRLEGTLRRGDSSSSFMFANGLREASPEAMEETLRKWDAGATDDSFRGETRLADALLSARLAFPADKAKRMVVFTDGAETARELATSLAQLKAEGIDVIVSETAGASKPEAALVSFKSSAKEAFLGETLRFEAIASANVKMKAKLRITNKAVLVKELPLELEAGKGTRASFEFPARKGLGDEWTAEIVPEHDQFPLNNKASCKVNVKGGAKLLALHVKPERLRPFAKAMREQDIDVEIRGRQGLPGSIREMLEFDAIMLADIPATSMTTSQMEALKSYVRDYGAGLIMTGSENSFGLGGYFKTPVEDVLPLLSRYQKEKEQPSLGIVFVIDKSGSMDGEKIAMAREAAKAAIEVLSHNDYVGVVAFDGSPYKVCEMVSMANSQEAIAGIDSIAAGGGTSMHPGMAMGKEMLSSSSAKIKHMILLTDGMSEPGDFLGLASEMSDMSMTVSTVALGSDADRALMARIADLGRGRYYEAAEASTMPRIFSKEAIEASRSAIKEEPFNPVKTGSADFLDGLDFASAPPLMGYVMTRARPAAKVLLLTENGDPLLATGRFGLGSSAAFASDASSQWASEWLDWKGYGKFWSQLARSLMRSASSSGISVESFRRGDDTVFRTTCLDQAGNPRDFIDWDASVSIGDAAPAKLEPRQCGCGVYELSVKIPDGSSCELRLSDKSGGQLKTVEIPASCPKEYLLDTSRQESFNKLKRLGSSGVCEDISSVKTQFPLRSILCLLALLSMLCGVLLRRI